MRLMETSNIAFMKNCFTRKKSSDNIVELRTATRSQARNQQNLNLPTNQKTLWKRLCINEENTQTKFEEDVSSIYENIA